MESSLLFHLGKVLPGDDSSLDRSEVTHDREVDDHQLHPRDGPVTDGEGIDTDQAHDELEHGEQSGEHHTVRTSEESRIQPGCTDSLCLGHNGYCILEDE